MVRSVTLNCVDGGAVDDRSFIVNSVNGDAVDGTICYSKFC